MDHVEVHVEVGPERVEDAQAATAALRDAGIRVLRPEEIYAVGS